MKVDRIAFLGLVTAVSAGACVVTTSDSGDGDGGTGGTTVTTSQGGSGATGGSTSQGGSTGGSTSQGGGGGDVGGSGGSGGAACDDTVGTPSACANIPVGCEPYCLAAHENLKAMVAEVAVQCMSSDVDDYCPTGYDCISDALAGACADDTADTDCATVVTACDATTAEQCHDLMDGLTDAARTEVMVCVDADGQDPCYFGLYSCVEGISFLDAG